MAILDIEGRTLAAELVQLFGLGVEHVLDDAAFNDLALRVFAYQFQHNQPYAAYARLRGRTPGEIAHWSQIPVVPTAAFKEVALVSGDAAAAEAVFRTSGTTRGTERRGEHYLPDLALYHASLLPNFAAHLLPDGAELPILSLLPPASEMPDSSLAHMIEVVIDRLGAPGSGSYATVERGIDEAALGAALRGYEEAGTPVCLLGTSFAFVHWTDALRERGERFQLAPGSRLMDTGGFKGRSREVDADELRATYGELLGIPENFLVNEYGMAEMCSQFYDNVLRDNVLRDQVALHGKIEEPDREVAQRDQVNEFDQEVALRDLPQGEPASSRPRPRQKVAPPWVRTVVVDPETLEAMPPGELGILRHYDLANLGSVIGVQTEDLGRAVEGGFLLLGRAAGAPPRGCSIATDLLLEAVAGHPQ